MHNQLEIFRQQQILASLALSDLTEEDEENDDERYYLDEQCAEEGGEYELSPQRLEELLDAALLKSTGIDSSKLEEVRHELNQKVKKAKKRQKYENLFNRML